MKDYEIEFEEGEAYRRHGCEFREGYVLGKVVTGSIEAVNIGNVVGFCKFFAHRGIITKNVDSTRECTKGKCIYLERWFDHEQPEQNKKKKEKEKEREAFQKTADMLLEDIFSYVSEYVSAIGHPIKVTSVIFSDKEQKVDASNPAGITIRFVSDLKKNDSWKYQDICFWVEEYFVENGRPVRARLQHIKGLDGKHLTLDEIPE